MPFPAEVPRLFSMHSNRFTPFSLSESWILESLHLFLYSVPPSFDLYGTPRLGRAWREELDNSRSPLPEGNAVTRASFTAQLRLLQALVISSSLLSCVPPSRIKALPLSPRMSPSGSGLLRSPQKRSNSSPSVTQRLSPPFLTYRKRIAGVRRCPPDQFSQSFPPLASSLSASTVPPRQRNLTLSSLCLPPLLSFHGENTFFFQPWSGYQPFLKKSPVLEAGRCSSASSPYFRFSSTVSNVSRALAVFESDCIIAS